MIKFTTPEGVPGLDESSILTIDKNEFLYRYIGVVTRIYDGDSFWMDLDLGKFTWVHNQRFRLLGANTPELRRPEREQGLVAKEMVISWMPIGTEVIVKTKLDKDDKYGRLLADVFIPLPDGPEGHYFNLSEYLIANGFAVEYMT